VQPNQRPAIFWGRGGLEAIFTILALRDQIVPPTLNLNDPDSAGKGLGFVAKEPQSKVMEYARSNGFGFRVVDASVLFRRLERGNLKQPPKTEPTASARCKFPNLRTIP